MNIPPGPGGFTICFLLYSAGTRGFFVKKYAPGEIRERLVFRLCFLFPRPWQALRLKAESIWVASYFYPAVLLAAWVFVTTPILPSIRTLGALEHVAWSGHPLPVLLRVLRGRITNLEISFHFICLLNHQQGFSLAHSNSAPYFASWALQ